MTGPSSPAKARHLFEMIVGAVTTRIIFVLASGMGAGESASELRRSLAGQFPPWVGTRIERLLDKWERNGTLETMEMMVTKWAPLMLKEEATKLVVPGNKWWDEAPVQMQRIVSKTGLLGYVSMESVYPHRAYDELVRALGYEEVFGTAKPTLVGLKEPEYITKSVLDVAERWGRKDRDSGFAINAAMLEKMPGGRIRDAFLAVSAGKPGALNALESVLKASDPNSFKVLEAALPPEFVADIEKALRGQ